MQVRDVVLYFSLKYKGDWNQIYDAIKNLEIINSEDFELMKKRVNCDYITIMDKEYPECLKNISKPPYVLFYYGDISLLKKKNKLAIVGSRKACNYASKATDYIIKGLINTDCVIISGLAKGIDSIAHSSALKNGIDTIAVLGTGIDYCYPKENFELYNQIKEYGLLLSEYPYKEIVSKEAFSFRNRIISGLSSFVFVPDVHERSGTNVSIRYALSQGKDIFTIPYSIFEDNLANRLIQDGAKIIIQANDIIEEFH